MERLVDCHLQLYFELTISPAGLNSVYLQASDKCDSESECLSFSQHMTVTGEMWSKHLNRTGEWNVDLNPTDDDLRWQPTVVFTTEATSMMEEQKAFVAENQTVSRYPQYNFQYMTNHHDVTPDSGFIRHVGTSRFCRSLMSMNDSFELHVSNTYMSTIVSDFSTNDADAIMISALSSLKAQLLPRLSIGNCCSNFHVLLNDFLLEGCGAASTNTFHCIQESEDPLLVVCCGWHHDCHDRKEKILFAMMNATN